MTHCEDCPLKLNLKGYREPQVYGNPFGNLVVVVPYIATGSIEDDEGVKEVVRGISSTGGDTLNYCVASMLQCNPSKLGHKVRQSYYVDCLKRTLIKYNLAKRHILLCGLEPINMIVSATNVGVWIDKVFCWGNQRFTLTYSPRVKFVDNEKGEVFTNSLVKWYNAAINNDYSGYERL